MIVTFTANPSIDATMSIDRLFPGGVLRVSDSSREPGGKGINVSNAVLKAGQKTLAIAPVLDSDPFVALASGARIPLQTVPVDGRVRTNTTVTEADGRTTKFNEPGAPLDDVARDALQAQLISAAADAQAVVLAGSLPPGAPTDWYTQLVGAIRKANPDVLIAVDTSDEPLRALGRNLETAAPDVVKPNGFELGQLAGLDGEELERQADAGHLDAVLEAAQGLVDKRVGQVLVTLGGAGACLVTADGAWHASPPPATVRSTVGAGDSSLAGYVLARLAGKDYPDALRQAVAYGTAAAANPGTEIPSPEDLDLDRTTVHEI